MAGFFVALIFSLSCVLVLSSSSSSLQQDALLSDVKQGDSWRSRIGENNVRGGVITAKERVKLHYTIALGVSGGGGRGSIGGARGGGSISGSRSSYIPVYAGNSYHKGAAASWQAEAGSCALIAAATLATRLEEHVSATLFNSAIE